MKDQKFHLTENGPAPCRVRFRRCKYETEGNEAEINAIWQKQLEEEFGEQLLVGTARSDAKENSSPVESEAVVIDLKGDLEATRIAINNELKYFPDPNSRAIYYRAERNIAMKLAATTLDESSYAAVIARDENWTTNGKSDVRRYKLSDGSAGYFKSLKVNSLGESFFTEFGTNSLAACISEVNAYRMSQLMGGGFSNLVPKTEIRSIDGEIGSLQIEVDELEENEPSFSEYKGLREDYRKAAIFDFVIGNLDRHDENFLYGKQGDEFMGRGNRPAIRLIDNSMAFIKSEYTLVNKSIFSQNSSPSKGYHGLPSDELSLNLEEIEALHRARDGVMQWIADGSMMKANGDETMLRIDFMLDNKSICNIATYYPRI